MDFQILGVLALLGGLVAFAWLRGGSELLGQGLAGGLTLLKRFGLLIVLSLLAAGIAEALAPRAWIESALGTSSGLRGLLIGTAAGAATPSGPFVSMPLAALLLGGGAGIGPVVAFVASWSLLAVHRLLAWEIPILGWRVALLRYTACLALPLLAGLIASSIARALARSFPRP